jgi:transglutaminase-like putative cysteine protease
MLYDVRLVLHYAYASPVHGGRHLVRVMPVSIPGIQRVIAASLSFDPEPAWQETFTDFFSNVVTTIAYRHAQDHLDVKLTARISVEPLEATVDLSGSRDTLSGDIADIWSLGPTSPHHFLAPSPKIPVDAEITDYALAHLTSATSLKDGVMALCQAIHKDFRYVPDVTDVDTTPLEAFTLRKGVCQDFTHIMISGLRGAGIPAGYVSGFLRTLPPPGRPRLEGADAMHAWVRVWCGSDMGWIEFDPTNAVLAGPDHIVIGYGRDYSDISPIVGVVKTSGRHNASQAVDVIPVE